MKEIYDNLQIEVITFKAEDIIITSETFDTYSGGNMS